MFYEAVLVVGVGGIGCELVKNLILSGFRSITLVDLDTIELSNLNRQFLFCQKHIGKSKALVAKEVLLEQFSESCPDLCIEAHFASIFDTQVCSFEFFSRFKVVFSALDNLEARRHLNRVCLTIGGIPVVESGSAGYLGQVSASSLPGKECFDCNPHPVPTSWPVCTIRNTPTSMVHCVIWAKEFVFRSVFSNAASSSYAEDKEANSLASLSAFELAKTLFISNVEASLRMQELWQNSCVLKPVPLEESFLRADCAMKGDSRIANNQVDSQSSLNDEHAILSLSQCVELFYNSFSKLRSRQTPFSFDKDDDEALNFVVSCALLRASCYGIPLESKFSIKAIAGNIIPAISTTNAIIAALATLNGIKLLLRNHQFSQHVSSSYLTYGNPHKVIVTSSSLHPPNPECAVCSVKRALLKVKDFSCFTIKDFAEQVVPSLLSQEENPSEIEELSIYSSCQRLVYDLDLPEMLPKTLSELDIISNSFLTVVVVVAEGAEELKTTFEIGIYQCPSIGEDAFSIYKGGEMLCDSSDSSPSKKRIKIDKN